MNVNDLFKKKPARKAKPGGLTQEQADAIEAEFKALIEPVADKATQLFRGFSTPGGKPRFWLLPASEVATDLPIEKQQYVLRYRDWFLKEINQVVLDDLNY